MKLLHLLRSRTKRWLTPPLFPGEEEKMHHARLMYRITLISLGMLLAYIIFGLPLGLLPGFVLPVSLGVVGLLGLTLSALRRGSVRGAAALFLLIIGVCLIPNLLLTGGVFAPGFVLFLLAMVVARTFLSLRLVYMIATAGSLTGLGLALLQEAGQLTARQDIPFSAWLFHTLILLLAALVLQATGPSLGDALSRARKELNERVLAEQELRRSHQRLAFLHEVYQAILSAHSMEEIAQRCTGRILTLMECQRVTINIIDTENRTLRVLATTGTSDVPFQVGDTFPMARGSLINGMARGEIKSQEDLEAVDDLSPAEAYLRRLGFRSYVNIRLVAQGRLIGTLGIVSVEPRSYDQTRLEIAQECADAVALALYQADLLDRVQRHAVELEERVRERTADLEQQKNVLEAQKRRMEQQKNQLELTNRELEAFSYSVSHDLRAPLRAVSGFEQALTEEYSGHLDETGRDYLSRIHTASQRMIVLIDDLLKLSRVSRVELEPTLLDLAALAREIRSDLQEDSPRVVEWVIPDHLPAQGDPNLARILLSNLLGNAWKFTARHPRSRIELGCLEREGETVYFVRDDGAGFNMDYAARLFGAFQRLHSPAEFEGSGIGLAIAQRVVRRHGGRIWAEGAVEQGATFFFTLG